MNVIVEGKESNEKMRDKKDEGEVVKKKKKTGVKHETQTYDSPVSLKNTGSFLLIRHIHNTQIYAQTQAEAATLLV